MIPTNIDIICLSHLRWGFVFQRPQHLMSRFAGERRVFFWEEPIFDGSESRLQSRTCPKTGVVVVTPVLPVGTTGEEATRMQTGLIRNFASQHRIGAFIAWYYTPMAIEFTLELKPTVTVYDCMDQLAAFAGAPRTMHVNEAKLFERADLVFTGGASLYASKRKQHSAVYKFPSSVDTRHFGKARASLPEPVDQSNIPRPRLGYAGVIDERMDLNLLRRLAESRPDWQLILVGPVAKIDPASLPRAANIHYLGMKKYDELPTYFSGWDAGLLPFAINESTRYISPTKTPEYLAAGLPVVSTPIRDVVSPYRALGLVEVASNGTEFLEAAEKVLRRGKDPAFLRAADEFLARSSWDKTWAGMNRLIERILRSSEAATQSENSSSSDFSTSQGLSYV